MARLSRLEFDRNRTENREEYRTRASVIGRPKKDTARQEKYEIDETRIIVSRGNVGSDLGQVTWKIKSRDRGMAKVWKCET